jgi:hypothetical protein
MGLGSEIRDPEKTYSRSRIQGSKRYRIPDPGSGSATLVKGTVQGKTNNLTWRNHHQLAALTCGWVVKGNSDQIHVEEPASAESFHVLIVE